MKTFAKVLAGLLVLAALAWTGMFLYWHVTIVGALRTLETQPGLVQEMEAFKTLQDGAGCRALPYLVAALQPTKSPYFLERASLLIQLEGAPHPMQGPQWGPNYDPVEFRLPSEDSAAERQRKIGLIRLYWKQKGHRHHQFWRVWSKSCVGNADSNHFEY